MNITLILCKKGPLAPPPLPPPAALSVVSNLWLNGWSRPIWFAILVNNIMDLHISSISKFLPEGLWYLLYATRCQDYWGLTHTHWDLSYSHKDTQYTQWQVDWHTYINIYLHQLLCAQSSYLYYIDWIIHWYQKFIFRNVFSVQKLFISKTHI